jgi:hypothetical protein
MLLSRVVDSPGTKGVPLVSGGTTNRDKSPTCMIASALAIESKTFSLDRVITNRTKQW